MAVPALAERAGVGPAWGAGAVLLSWLSVSLVCVMTVIAWMGRRAGIGQAGVGGWGVQWPGPGRLAGARQFPACCLCAGPGNKQICVHSL